MRNGLLVVRVVAPASSRQSESRRDGGATGEELQGQTTGPAPQERTIPREDIAVVVAAHPQVTFTLAVVAGLARHGGLLVTCDERRQPAAMTLPLETHHAQTARYAAQAQLPLPARKRLWQAIARGAMCAAGGAAGAAGGRFASAIPDCRFKILDPLQDFRSAPGGFFDARALVGVECDNKMRMATSSKGTWQNSRGRLDEFRR